MFNCFWKPTEDAHRKNFTLVLLNDEIGKISGEMQTRTRTPKKNAATRQTKIPCQESSVGKVVKKRKGSPKLN